MAMAPRYRNKTVDEYRQLAQKFREIARMTLGEDERTRLLEVAQTWDLIADRRAARGHESLIKPSVGQDISSHSARAV